MNLFFDFLKFFITGLIILSIFVLMSESALLVVFMTAVCISIINVFFNS